MTSEASAASLAARAVPILPMRGPAKAAAPAVRRAVRRDMKALIRYLRGGPCREAGKDADDRKRLLRNVRLLKRCHKGSMAGMLRRRFVKVAQCPV
ncbi:hypothetical protein GCM10029978_035480 [Actinoallomurus acanthiterrae]